MKKALLWGLVFTFAMAIPQSINTAGADEVWKDWNLVKDGALDTSKWYFNDRQVDGVSVVTMSIDGERVKFEHRPDTAGASVWLQLIKKPECVKGIQAEITMGTDLDGDFRARIGTVAGAYGPLKDFAWSQAVVRNRLSGDSVYGAADLEDPLNDWEWLNDLIWSGFNNPEEVDGNTYICTMILDREKGKIKYTVEGLGTVVYKMSDEIKPGWEAFWGIGSRSSDALGSGTVWFSNVRVLLDTECGDDARPAVKKTVPEHKQVVTVQGDTSEIKFNEPMDAFRRASCEDCSCCPQIYRKEADGTWLNIGALGEFVYQPTNTFTYTKPPEVDDLEPGKYKVVVTQDYFYDLAGNGNEEYSFKFTIAP
jgi:hypothetical protein